MADEKEDAGTEAAKSWEGYLKKVPEGLRQKIIDGLDSGGISYVKMPTTAKEKKKYPFGKFVHINQYVLVLAIVVGGVAGLALLNELGYVDDEPTRKEKRQDKREDRKEKRQKRREKVREKVFG